MKNAILLLIAIATSLCSCNMANHYANKRISHSTQKIQKQEVLVPTLETTVTDESTHAVAAADSLETETIEQETAIIHPYKKTVQETKAILPVPIAKTGSHKDIKIKKPRIVIPKKIRKSFHSESASVNFDALDWNWGIIALVIVFLSVVGAIIATASSFTLLSFLAALAGIFLGIFAVVASIFFLFAFVYIFSFAWLWT